MYKKFREHLDKMSDWLEDNKAKLPRDEDEEDEEDEEGTIVAYMDGDPDEEDVEGKKKSIKKNFDKKMFG